VQRWSGGRTQNSAACPLPTVGLPLTTSGLQRKRPSNQSLKTAAAGQERLLMEMDRASREQTTHPCIYNV
jgi:hypothetical protein